MTALADHASMRVAVVIPTRNESHSIGDIVAAIRDRYPDFDIIVVDDASEDGSGQIATKAGAKVLRLPIRLGYGGAVQTGLKCAYRKKYDLVVLMDADGQHDPESIKQLVEASKHYDLVIGSRFLGEASYKIPFVRLIGMKIFSFLTSLIIGKRITDTSSGFQAISREVCGLFALGHYPVDFPDADMIIWVARNGYRVGEVGVIMHERKIGRSMISGIRSSLKYALKMPLAILVTILRVPGIAKGEVKK
ncbi:MAG: glycosyltransferase family 2 protein [bacterium]